MRMAHSDSNPVDPRDLSIISCHLILMPDPLDCSPYNHSDCIRCTVHGHFLSGNSPDDYTASGHTITLLLWLVTCIVGTFGTFANILIIFILKRQHKERPFDTFLMGLAAFDILCSFSSVLCLTGCIFIIRKWSTSYATWLTYYTGFMIVLLGHTGSSFATVLISLERFLVVTFPMQCGGWFTRSRNRWAIFMLLVWSLFLVIPRLSSFYISKNEIGSQYKSLQDVDYLIEDTRLSGWMFHDANPLAYFDLIDLWLPLPLLVIFNALLYFQVLKFEKRRKELTARHQRDVRAARMFLPVVVAVFVCHVGPMIHIAYNYSSHIYTELYFCTIFSFALNSAVNLPIYYLKGTTFQRETLELLAVYFPSVRKYQHATVSVSNVIDNSTGTTGMTKEATTAV